MKIKLTVLVLAMMVFSPVLDAQKKKEPYFYQVVATPNKSLNFNLYAFHYKYRWVESEAAGNYTRVSLVVQNKSSKALNWKDYKIYFLLKDGTLFHNYTTSAKKGNFMCRYTIEPDGQQVQFICFAKKFNPRDVDRAWIKMTNANFIKLQHKDKPGTTTSPAAPRGSGGFATPPVIPNNPSTKFNQGGTRAGTNADARALLRLFLQPGADHRRLTQLLRPNEADYKAYFTQDSWQQAMREYDSAWDQGLMMVKPKAGQSELLMWPATVIDLDEGIGNAGKFPGGYKKVMIHIRLGHTIYRFKFVEPGKTLGMAYDGLVFLNGRWVMFPKPWRIFR